MEHNSCADSQGLLAQFFMSNVLFAATPATVLEWASRQSPGITSDTGAHPKEHPVRHLDSPHQNMEGWWASCLPGRPRWTARLLLIVADLRNLSKPYVELLAELKPVWVAKT